MRLFFFNCSINAFKARDGLELESELKNNKFYNVFALMPHEMKIQFHIEQLRRTINCMGLERRMRGGEEETNAKKDELN